MNKKIFFLVAIIIIVIAGRGLYLYKKPRTDISDIKAVAVLDAVVLYNFFQNDEVNADKKFGDKIVDVKGIVQNVQRTDSTSVIELKGAAMGGINCSLAGGYKKETELPVKGALVTIKGRCTGYLIDVNLVDCVIEN